MTRWHLDAVTIRNLESSNLPVTWTNRGCRSPHSLGVLDRTVTAMATAARRMVLRRCELCVD